MSGISALAPALFPTAPVTINPGGGPILALHDCNRCNEPHPNPVFMTYADIPPEVVERVLGQVGNPLDMNRLSTLCYKFKALAVYVMYGRLASTLDRFDLGDPREFLRYLRRSGVYWAGPSLLSVLFPDLNIRAYDDRLDLHVQNSSFILSRLNSVLRNAGYELDSIHTTPDTIEAFALGHLDYPYFGSTVNRIMAFTKNVAGTDKEIVVFVSKSETTGFLSITEYPTTLFMLYVDGINLHILYPWLTGNCRGLINTPFLVPRPLVPPPLPSFVRTLAPFFDLKPRLSDWTEYLFHFCDHNTNCPLRLRHQLDNRSIALGCSLDHPEMRPYRRADPGRIFPPFPALEAQLPTLCIWRLRCCGSCVTNMPFPCQDTSYRGVYIADDLYIVEPRRRR